MYKDQILLKKKQFKWVKVHLNMYEF